MAREWAAEIGMLRQRNGTAWQRLAFALSLAVTPLTVDESGAPRGRWEWMRAGATLRTVTRVALAGAFGYGLALVVRSMANSLIDFDFTDDVQWLLGRTLAALVTAAVITVYAVLVGRWAGLRAAPEPGPTGSLGVAATVVLPLAVPIPFVLAVQTDSLFPAGLVIAVGWAVATGLLVVAGIRGARLWSLAGIPFAAALPAAGLILQGIPDLSVYLVAGMAEIALFLLPWTVCAVVFGRAVVRRWSMPVEYELPQDVPATHSTAPARFTVERVLLAMLAAASAVVWAIGMTVWQPLSEPTGPDATGENNTYWARELRWGALIAIVLVLLVQVRGDRRATRGVLLGGVAGLAADLLVDRLNAGPGATVVLAVVAALAAVAACVVAGTAALAPRPPVLLTVAVVAAVLSGTTTGTESPTDVETGLNLGSAAAGSLLAVIAVIAAVRAAGPVSRRRVLAAVPAGVLAATGPWLLRLRSPQPTDGRLYGILLFLVLILLTVVVLAGPRPRTARHWLRYPAAAAVAAVAVPVLMVPLIYVSIALPIGGLLTMLAGSPPINGADEDIVTALVAVLVGLVVGRLLRPLALSPAPRPEASRSTAPATRVEPFLRRVFQGS
ncbi:hypothetical protein L3i22_068770 [Actinoplanes sp. L3-i22]|nr:hypothetical protein L3i22_068770 [Actinoplanes sp. L3-i22]